MDGSDRRLVDIIITTASVWTRRAFGECFFLSEHPTNQKCLCLTTRAIIMSNVSILDDDFLNIFVFSSRLTWAPTMPFLSRGKSVCDQLLFDHGSTVVKSAEKLKYISWLCTNLRIFHGRSLCLEHKRTLIVVFETAARIFVERAYREFWVRKNNLYSEKIRFGDRVVQTRSFNLGRSKKLFFFILVKNNYEVI